MVALISLKTMNAARFCLIILFSNGVLERCAAMLRKLDRQNRAQNVQEQSHFLENVEAYRTERR